MKKVVCVMLMAVILLAGVCAYASGFSQDPDRIEQAAKSVLMLEVYNRQGKLLATGSGFVAFDSSTLVTNYHVIDEKGTYEIIAIGDDDRNYSITKVLCADEEADIAILGFKNKTSLEPLALWAEKNLKRGAPVVAIGSPKGQKNTVSKGDISAIFTDTDISVIQFTAPISPGSSGGALLNDDGKVIGITTGTLNEESQNINFAVHSAVVKAMYQAWDGTMYTLTNHKNTATFNYSGVYDESTETSVTSTTDTDAFVEVWSCPDCGNKNNSQFCLECGREKPSWKCRCGLVNHGKFCGSCGSSLQKMLDEMNDALSELDGGNYDQAIEALNALGAFNCLSMESNAGKNCSAEVQMQKAYYLRAEQKLAAYNFKQAYEDFIYAGSYSDAISRQYEVFYKQGLYQKERGRYADAMESFETAAKYYDVANEILNCHYQLAKQYAASEKFDDAIKEYELCGSYLDAQECILRAYYEKGAALFEQGSYSEALSAFTKAGDVLDAKERILAVYYAQGENALSSKQYAEAVALFTKAGDYSDAAKRVDEAKECILEEKYAAAEAEFVNKNYIKAVKAFQAIEGYKDAKERVKQCYYCLGERSEKNKKYEKASEYFESAGDYLDAATRKYDVLCDYAEKLIVSSPEKARRLLKGLNYERAEQLYLEITYKMAEKSYNQSDWAVALSLYKECLNYMDSLDKLKTVHQSLILQYLEHDNSKAAKTQFDIMKEQPWTTGDFVVAEPGSEGKSVAELLRVAKAMSFQGWYPDGEQTYKEKYKDAIVKMEKHFELEADGVIHCSEYIQLMEAIVPGSKGDEVRSLLEYICDLGYFDALGALPEKHDTYENRYQYSIKRLETDLKIKADGFLTAEEVAVIRRQKVSAPAAIDKLTLTQNKGTVFLSWTASKGAKWYEVYRDGEKLATVKGTNYTDKEAVQGQYNNYSVRACKYTKFIVRKNSIKVEISYIKTTCATISKEYSKYKNKYVEFSMAKIISRKVKGSDYHIIIREKVNGKNYYAAIVMPNYKNWEWGKDGYGNALLKMKMIGGKGEVYDKMSIGDMLYETDIVGNAGSIPYIRMNSITWNY